MVDKHTVWKEISEEEVHHGSPPAHIMREMTF